MHEVEPGDDEAENKVVDEIARGHDDDDMSDEEFAWYEAELNGLEAEFDAIEERETLRWLRELGEFEMADLLVQDEREFHRLTEEGRRSF